MADRVHVTGFLGSGKSSLVAHLRGLGGADAVELDALTDPAPHCDGPLICVADAANLRRWLRDEDLAPLVRQQIRCAGVIVLTRSDLVETADAIAALGDLTQAPVHDAPFGALPLSALEDLAPCTASEPVGDLGPAFARWTYDGPAVLRPDVLEELLRTRPRGVLRMTGTARTPEGGLEIEIVGRSRQTRPVRPPECTRLQACGLRRDFSTVEMDIRFAEVAAESVARTGIFRYR